MNAFFCHEILSIIFIKRSLASFLCSLLPTSVFLHAIKRTIGENFKSYEMPDYVK